ncbi:MAG TPA: redox-regulated ATPase YchF [Patescibacteria group bacterium]|nr:redox-regulated ATPase YchF [Patescibacteria group bacterium]
MNISVGIVGLPNVGKSTLFNALLKKQQALAANYPFATIEPNIGIVPVPDSRLTQLAEITKLEEKMSELPPLKPATVEFVDIAGLVKGASEGAGLGNKFLSHIREVSVIAHVVRAFVDENVIREGSQDPESDYAAIETELILSDLQSAMNHEARTKNPAEKALTQRIVSDLNTGTPVREMKFAEEELDAVRAMFFLTAKPEITVLNVSEDDYSLVNVDLMIDKYAKILQIPHQNFVVICAKIESELASLSEEEQKLYLHDLGFPTSGLERLIHKAYDRLGLISFLTAGEKEVRAWTVRKGIDAQHAAGEIHTDFIKKFIKAEVISFADYIATGGRKKAREVGKARLEGKDYIVQDGDVIEFKIGA